MEPSKTDWKKYRAKVPEWQEAYMGRLVQEYVELLNSDKLASEKFWMLNKRMHQDKKNPGVVIQMSRSTMIYNLVDLIERKVIAFEDLADFSDDLQDTIYFLIYRKKRR